MRYQILNKWNLFFYRKHKTTIQFQFKPLKLVKSEKKYKTIFLFFVRCQWSKTLTSVQKKKNKERVKNKMVRFLYDILCLDKAQ
jgi:hypothetical protein